MTQYVVLEVVEEEDLELTPMTYNKKHKALIGSDGCPWYGLNLILTDEKPSDVKGSSEDTTLLKLAAILSDPSVGKAYLDKE